ncbi:MAG: site-specific integrase [Acetatifactor sp.]|nr:site-specific integrase [Acetatifactor sp.]
MAKLPQGMTKRIIKGQTYYELRFTIDGNRHTVAAKDVKECLDKADQKREEIKARKLRRTGHLTLNEYRDTRLEAWRNSVTTARVHNEEYLYTIASKTPANREGTLLGDMILQEVERKHLEKVQAELAKRYSPTTVNAVISEVNSLLGYALEDQLIDRHPAIGYKKIRRTEKPARETIHRALTLEETERFFAAAEARHTWYLPLYEFLLNTGCRVGEATALFPSDVSKEEDGTLRIHVTRTVTKDVNGHLLIGNTTKTPSSKRVIHLNEAAKEALLRQRRIDAEAFDGNQPEVSGRGKTIFRSPQGCMVIPCQLNKDLKSICEKAGIERFSVHAFRDTFATRALESGMNPKTLQEILGHAKINMTMDLYAHVMMETKKEEMTAVVTRRAQGMKMSM